MTIDNYLDQPLNTKLGFLQIKKSIDHVSGDESYYLYDIRDEIFAKVERLYGEGFIWFTMVLGQTFRGTLKFSDLKTAE